MPIAASSSELRPSQLVDFVAASTRSSASTRTRREEHVRKSGVERRTRPNTAANCTPTTPKVMRLAHRQSPPDPSSLKATRHAGRLHHRRNQEQRRRDSVETLLACGQQRQHERDDAWSERDDDRAPPAFMCSHCSAMKTPMPAKTNVPPR